MGSYIQVLGTHPELVPPQLLIVHNNYRFLINAGENTQRFCVEHKIKLSRITDIILTQIHPSSVSGLLGLLLTLEAGEAGIASTIIEGGHSEQPVLERRRWTLIPGVLGAPWCQSFRRLVGSSNGQTCRKQIKTLRIWGPAPLFDFCRYAIKEFAGLRNLDIQLCEINPTKESPPVIVLPPPNEQTQNESGVSFQFWCTDVDSSVEPPSKRRRYEEVEDTRGYNERRAIKETAAGSQALLIVGQFPRHQGKMDTQKLDELQIPRGPWLAKLKSGESVKLADGREIHASQVCGESTDGERFLISGISNEAQISMSSCLPKQLAPLSAIFDLSAPQILMNSTPYSEFLASEAPKGTPILSCFNDRNLSQPFVSSACLQAVLRSLISSCFPLGIFDTQKAYTEETSQSSTLADSQSPTFATAGDKNVEHTSGLTLLNGHLLDRWVFSPNAQVRGLDTSSRLVETSVGSTWLQKMNRCENVADAVDKCRAVGSHIQAIESDDGTLTNHDNDECHNMTVRVVFLGTGSAIPSKYRNVSGILLKVFRGSQLYASILSDCGEGSLSQIYRFSSSVEDFESTLMSISFIFISHRHADHHLGLPSLLAARHQRFPFLPPPFVVASPFINPWLQLWNRRICPCPYEWIECEDGMTLEASKSDVALDPPSIELKFASVDHIQQSELNEPCFGIRVAIRKSVRIGGEDAQWKTSTKTSKMVNPLLVGMEATSQAEDQWVIAYSGDTRPCDSMINLARNCDLLLHEGTFEDEFQAEAIRKRHSTISEANDVALKSNAKYLLITHFSQRYPLIPVFTESMTFQRFSVAFDSLSICVNSLFKRDKTGKMLGDLLLEGTKLMKPILSCLRDEDSKQA